MSKVDFVLKDLLIKYNHFISIKILVNLKGEGELNTSIISQKMDKLINKYRPEIIKAMKEDSAR